MLRLYPQAPPPDEMALQDPSLSRIADAAVLQKGLIRAIIADEDKANQIIRSRTTIPCTPTFAKAVRQRR